MQDIYIFLILLLITSGFVAITFLNLQFLHKESEARKDLELLLKSDSVAQYDSYKRVSSAIPEKKDPQIESIEVQEKDDKWVDLMDVTADEAFKPK